MSKDIITSELLRSCADNLWECVGGLDGASELCNKIAVCHLLGTPLSDTMSDLELRMVGKAAVLGFSYATKRQQLREAAGDN